MKICLKHNYPPINLSNFQHVYLINWHLNLLFDGILINWTLLFSGFIFFFTDDIMAVIKVDNQTVAQTSWKPCSQQAWDQRYILPNYKWLKICVYLIFLLIDLLNKLIENDVQLGWRCSSVGGVVELLTPRSWVRFLD